MFSGIVSSDASKMGGIELVSDSSSIMVGVGLGEKVDSIVLLSVCGVDQVGVGVDGIVVGVGWGAWGYTTGVGEIP